MNCSAVKYPSPVRYCFPVKCAVLACWALVLQAAPAGPAAAPEPGSWQKHAYSFAFMGFTSTYSCDGLADKLRLLLVAAGARADVKVRPGACAGFGRPDEFSRADLTFYTLSPAGADASATDGAAGVWRSVQISDRSPRGVATGDCELVDQFRHEVLPMFTTRHIDARITCIPNEVSGSLVDLRFESFAAVPQKAVPPDRSGGTR